MDGLESGDDSSRRSKPSIYDAAPIKATGPAIGACARRAGARASVPRSAGHCPFKFFPTGDTDHEAGERASQPIRTYDAFSCDLARYCCAVGRRATCLFERLIEKYSMYSTRAAADCWAACRHLARGN